MTHLFTLEKDVEKDEDRLVWDYKNGFIIDVDTGEVVGQIFDTYPSMGFRANIDEKQRFIHYKVVGFRRKNLKRAQRYVWWCAWRYLLSSNIAMDPVSLARIVKMVFKAFRTLHPSVKAVATVFIAMRLSGHSPVLQNICRDFGIDSMCFKVYDVLRELHRIGISIPLENRSAKISALIEQFPDREVATVALRLLRFARADGKASTSVASTLLYIAGLLLNRLDVTMNRIAEFYKVSIASIRNNYKGKILPIRITLDKASVAVEIHIPRKLCEELKDYSLSPKVICK
jgi:transcription initiation factor TFIIIB Brf1 subunit/transcription initiation factor TFIIB